MKLQHIAFWTNDIGRSIEFYKKHFNARELFTHRDGDFSCTFISICSSIRLELMHKSGLPAESHGDAVGYSHLSIDVGSREAVDTMTDYFIQQGVPLEKQRVQYEDGYYESAVFDPDGNIIELAYVDEAVNPQAQQL